MTLWTAKESEKSLNWGLPVRGELSSRPAAPGRPPKAALSQVFVTGLRLFLLRLLVCEPAVSVCAGGSH